jgi:LuxR family maltose regulon positive regulatory protein
MTPGGPDHGDVPGTHGVGLAYAFAQALVDIERDRLDQAWTRLSSLQARPGAGGGSAAEPPLAELLGLLRARVLTHQGDLTAAKAELAGALDSATRLRPHVEHLASLLSVDITLHEGNGVAGRDGAAASQDASTAGATGGASAVASSTGSPMPSEAGRTDVPVAPDGPTPVFAADAVAAGRLHLAAGDPAAALEAVTPCLTAATAETRLLDTVAALLVAATAHRRLGTQASATGYLERALTLARDDELIRVFLDAGRGVRALLTVAIPPQGPHAGFRSSLLHRFDVQPAATWRSPDQLTRLTASERAVLRYLPSHLTNEEIAQDLCLSVNTVKSHLRTLYRKLGVTCRREAIARALQLELLR